jgi:hypothetical protein
MASLPSKPALARQMSGQDPLGRYILSVLVKATYTLTPQGRVFPAEEKVPLNTGLVRDSELHLLVADTDLYPHKLATDVVLKGHAHSYRPLPSFKVSLRVGWTEKVIQVLGDRTCHLAATGRLSFSQPEPVTRVPLRYDRAYGGEDRAAAARHGNPHADLQRRLAPQLAALNPRFFFLSPQPCGTGISTRRHTRRD